MGESESLLIPGLVVPRTASHKRGGYKDNKKRGKIEKKKHGAWLIYVLCTRWMCKIRGFILSVKKKLEKF